MSESDFLRFYELIPCAKYVYYCDIRQAFAFCRDKVTGEEKRARITNGTYDVLTLEEFHALWA